MDEKINIEIVPYGSEVYKEVVALREEVLRKPLNLTFSAEDLAAEKDFIHVACYLDRTLVATTMLVPREETLVVKRVAVKPDLQGHGLGSALMDFCERYAIDHGFSALYCHARISALTFYLRNGFEEEGEEFLEVGIPHIRMRKNLYAHLIKK